MAKSSSAPRGSFVQSYGSDSLDASGLLMLRTFFMAPDDPRTRATVDAIRSPATRGGLAADGLVYRYDPKAAPDGLPGVEGTFNMCSFWLVEALNRAGRTDPDRLAEARLLACCSSRCWVTATMSRCTPSRPGRAARRRATSRRPSPTWG